MTPLPDHAGPAVFWRLDDKQFETTWDSGEGSRRKGGRWSPIGIPAVHCAFTALNAIPHVLTAASLTVAWSRVHVVHPKDVPNKLWLYPCALSAAQQAFGSHLLTAYDFVVIPSAVSRHSWILIFDAPRPSGINTTQLQEELNLDPRLDPPKR